MRLTAVPEAKLGGIYKRLETDAEYHARLRAAGKRPPVDVFGAMLDAHGDAHGMQRRIVESSAD
jgi:hypothetical protein